MITDLLNFCLRHIWPFGNVIYSPLNESYQTLNNIMLNTDMTV